MAAWLGWVLDAFDATIYLLVMKDIAKEFGVGIIAVAGSMTLTLLVRLLGGFVAGWMAGSLFLRTFERAERVGVAMQSRGFTGLLPPPPPRPLTRRDHQVLLAQVLAQVLLVGVL